MEYNKTTWDTNYSNSILGNTDNMLKDYVNNLYSTIALTNEVITDAKIVKVAKIETIVALTPGATVAIDMSTASNFSLAPVQNFTLSNPTGLTAGQRGFITITQDSTGSRLLSLGTNFITVGGSALTLTTTAAAVDLLRYEVLSATVILVELVADIK